MDKEEFVIWSGKKESYSKNKNICKGKNIFYFMHLPNRKKNGKEWWVLLGRAIDEKGCWLN